jgi:chemotaxis protein CheD
MNRESPLLEKIYLKPGELMISEEAVLVTTVLGSCISVTMFHPQTGTAAICHAMQPCSDGSESFKYVDSSVQHMVICFSRRKIRLVEIQVKLFGGADMFRSTASSMRSLTTIGRQNISVATECLKAHGLVPAATDVGGRKGRKLIFKTDTGTVFLKRLSHQDQVLLCK